MFLFNIFNLLIHLNLEDRILLSLSFRALLLIPTKLKANEIEREEEEKDAIKGATLKYLMLTEPIKLNLIPKTILLISL